MHPDKAAVINRQRRGCFKTIGKGGLEQLAWGGL